MSLEEVYIAGFVRTPFSRSRPREPEKVNVKGGAIAIGHPLGAHWRALGGDPLAHTQAPRRRLWGRNSLRRRRTGAAIVLQRV